MAGAEAAMKEAFDSYLESALPVLGIKPRPFNSVLQSAKKSISTGKNTVRRGYALAYGFTLAYLLRMRPAQTSEQYILNLAADSATPELIYASGLVRDVYLDTGDEELTLIGGLSTAAKTLSALNQLI